MLDSLELKLVIRKQGSEYTAVTQQSDGTQICANTFQFTPAQFLPLDTSQLHPEKESASWIVRRITGRKPRNSLEIQTAKYGARLYQYAFGSSRKFRDLLRTHKNHQDIHLKLVFTPNASGLSALPWEYLYDGKAFLGIDRNVQITRQSDKYPSFVPAPTREPLRILALIANPLDQKALNFDEELTRLHNIMELESVQDKVELDVISEVTPFACLRALRDRFYHVIYFVGYGKYDLMQQRSYLCFEDAWGETELVGSSQFKKLLQYNKPHVIIINARSPGQVSGHNPYHNFALECLQLGIPALLYMPSVLNLHSLDIFLEELLNCMVDGQSVGESVQAARIRLYDHDETHDREKRFDWGVVNCYTGSKRVQPLISTGQEGSLLLDTEAKGSIASIFVDRKSELQNLRMALKENVSIIYLLGHIGVGKSTLIDQLLYHTSVHFKGVLRIKCDTLQEPLSVINKISSFWAGHAPPVHQQAADLLLDSRQDPFVRAEAAQKHLGQYRYLLIFENIDTWFAETQAQEVAEEADRITNPLVRSILLGLLHAESSTTFLFTGTRRWVDLSALPSSNRREIPLPFLNPRWADQLMINLPGLCKVTRQARETIYWQMGGHPFAIKLLAAWLLADSGNDLSTLFQDSPIRDRSTADWITYLLSDIIHNLDPGEAQVLPVTAVLNRPFTDKIVPKLTLISSQYASALLKHWRNLELIQDTGVIGQYQFHRLVRNFILDRISTGGMAQLHLQAAEYFGAPFIDEARRHIYTRNVNYQSEERVTWLARDINGILGKWLNQEQDEEKIQELLDLAMSWHYHCFYAGEYQAAVQIARAIVPVLHRRGLRDLAESLLQRAISSAEGYDRAVSMDNLAKIKIADGHLAGALNVYEEVYKALLSHGTDLQRAHVLARSAGVQQQMGLWQDAILRYEQALKVMRKQGDQQGQAVCLSQLSAIYRQHDHLQQALVYSQASKEMYNKLLDDKGLASAAHEQGHILSDMNHLDGALENYAESMRLCRRTGDLTCVAANLYEIGNVLQRLGKTAMAIRALEEADNLYEMLAAPERVDVRRLLKELYEQQQRLTDAVQRFKAAKNGGRKGKRFLSRRS